MKRESGTWLDAYHYVLPEEQIAQYPLPERAASRLMVLDRATGEVRHSRFRGLASWLKPGDLLVLNDTRVIPARVHARKTGTGGKLDILLVRRLEPEVWECVVRSRRRLHHGTELEVADGVRAVLEMDGGGDSLRVRFPGIDADEEFLSRIGEMPLPPYIDRDPEKSDRERYQTVYARVPGAIAAPTAGLHFSIPLLSELEEAGVEITKVLLHVGLATFAPLPPEQPTSWDPEYLEISEETAGAIARCRERGGRVVAVGTTVVRALESTTSGTYKGDTDLFIASPYVFRSVDVMITNFHLPGSSVLVLTAAFAGRERLLSAYREAIDRGYRFYSYGDAMLIV